MKNRRHPATKQSSAYLFLGSPGECDSHLGQPFCRLAQARVQAIGQLRRLWQLALHPRNPIELPSGAQLSSMEYSICSSSNPALLGFRQQFHSAVLLKQRRKKVPDALNNSEVRVWQRNDAPAHYREAITAFLSDHPVSGALSPDGNTNHGQCEAWAG